MPRHARKAGLSRRHRFAERGSFGPVLRSPCKIRGRLAALHAVAAHGANARLGIALTRRLVPSSVDRNYIKRMVREAFRVHEVKAGGFDCVISLRERYVAESAPALRSEVVSLFDQLARQVR